MVGNSLSTLKFSAASAFLPWLMSPLLRLGGVYLCYE